MGDTDLKIYRLWYEYFKLSPFYERAQEWFRATITRDHAKRASLEEQFLQEFGEDYDRFLEYARGYSTKLRFLDMEFLLEVTGRDDFTPWELAGRRAIEHAERSSQKSGELVSVIHPGWDFYRQLLHISEEIERETGMPPSVGEVLAETCSRSANGSWEDGGVHLVVNPGSHTVKELNVAFQEAIKPYRDCPDSTGGGAMKEARRFCCPHKLGEGGLDLQRLSHCLEVHKTVDGLGGPNAEPWKKTWDQLGEWRDSEYDENTRGEIKRMFATAQTVITAVEAGYFPKRPTS